MASDSILTRFRNAWNLFRLGDEEYFGSHGPGSGTRPDRTKLFIGTERTIISSIYNRIGIDVASIGIRHARMDENDNFLETINSGIDNCLTLEANIDQSGRAFIQDIVMSMCDEGVVAIVPTDTTIDPRISGSYDVLTMRTARIIQWFPEHVMVHLYNQKTGMKQRLTLPKTMVAIVENPLYAVMNEPNSTLKRLAHKLSLLDVIDNKNASGKLDIIVQLPYAIKTELKQKQADARRKSIEAQLKDAEYGIAYIDATEKVTQLNRPAENNLLAQIDYLTSMLYSQLGLTKEIFDGTADETKLLNYHNRTVEPIVSAITDAMKRVFITKTGRSQGQSIVAIRDPFRLIPAETLAELADKLTRNEILSSNEFRAKIGMKPSKDPKADELRNKNLNQKVEEPSEEPGLVDKMKNPKFSQNGSPNEAKTKA